MSTALPLSMSERDLGFHPVRNENPKKLTAEEITFFNENGYLKGFRIFNGAEVECNRRTFDDLLRRIAEADDGRDSYSINNYQDRSASIYDIARTPRILDYVEDILGPDFVCWGSHFFCKMPGDGKTVAWHQDASYWALTPSKTVTVWLAIDDTDVENGCMQVIPGTHTMGHLEFKPSEASENNVLNQTIVDADSLGTPVPFELRAGEISLHTDMLVHGSQPNRSQRRRCGLTLRYAATDVRAITARVERNANSILCRGTDPSGHWADIPRPQGESIEPADWEIERLNKRKESQLAR